MAKEKSSIDVKQLLLIIGLTVVLSVAASLATVSLTGNTVYAWDDAVGGYVTGNPTPETIDAVVSNVAANVVLSNDATKQLVADMFNSAYVVSGKSGEWNCNTRCSDSGMQCVSAMYAPENEKPYLVGCNDIQGTGIYSLLSCVCVNPTA